MIDLRNLDAEDTAQRLSELRAQLSHQTLDLTEAGGLDVRLALLADGWARLLLDVDMTVCDGLSLRTVVSDSRPGRAPGVSRCRSGCPTARSPTAGSPTSGSAWSTSTTTPGPDWVIGEL